MSGADSDEEDLDVGDCHEAFIRIKKALAFNFSTTAADTFERWVLAELEEDEKDIDSSNGYSVVIKSLQPVIEDFDGISRVRELAYEEELEIAENSMIVDDIQQECSSKLPLNTYQIFNCIRAALFAENVKIVQPRNIFQLDLNSNANATTAQQKQEAIEAARVYLSQQYSKVFGQNSNMALLELFAIGMQQNIPDLPSMLFEIYSQWRMAQRLRADEAAAAGHGHGHGHGGGGSSLKSGKSHANKQILSATQFVNKSKAFKHLTKNIRELIANGINCYGHRFSPAIQKLTPTLINDSLYAYCKYILIVSQCIQSLLDANSLKTPFQLDFWIVPRRTKNVYGSSEEDDDSSSDEDHEYSDDEHKQDNNSNNTKKNNNNNENQSNSKFNIFKRSTSDQSSSNLHTSRDNSIFEIHKRLERNFVKHDRFEFNDAQFLADANSTRTKLRTSIESMVHQTTHNRLVCILDRRQQYFAFKECSKKDMQEHAFSENGESVFGGGGKKHGKSGAKKFKRVSEIDFENRSPHLMEKNAKKPVTEAADNRLYVYQPPAKFGRFENNFCQERLFWLSKEYLFPYSKVKNSNGDFTFNYGSRYDFNGQMFLLSFCCHTAVDIRLYWYFNSWMIRVDDMRSILKLWPKYFASVSDEERARIEREVLQKWNMKLTDEIYDIYKEDLLKF